MANNLLTSQGWYVSESLPISSQECVNLYPAAPETNTITDMALFGTPGLVEQATAAAFEFNRGGHSMATILYEVNGNILYRINRTFDNFGVASYSSEDVSGGVSLPGDQRVIIEDNGVQMCIVVPEDSQTFNAWIYTEADGLIQISDAGFSGPVNTVGYIDGYFSFTQTDGNAWFTSQLRDGLNFIATDFTNAEVDPDPIKAQIVLRNQIIIFGSKTGEPYYNPPSTGAGFPFQRIEGGVIQKGVLAADSMAEISLPSGEDAIVWVGSGENEQPAIWLSGGGSAQKISTSAIDNELRKYPDSDVTNAFALKYTQSGNTFVAFTFPNQATFTRNFSSGLWFTQESSSNNQPIPWRVTSITDAYGELWAGDSISPKIGILDKETLVEYDDTFFRRRFSTPPGGNNGDPLFMDSMELLAETGNATQTGPGSDPQVMMSFSDDGGRNFNNPMTRSLGKIGEYEKRIVWNRLGRAARERAFKFEFSDPAKVVILRVEMNSDG